MSSSFIRWGGLAAMVGGALWIVATLIHASKPRGCIAEECAFRPMRESGALVGILTLLSVVLMAVGAAGLVILARRSGRFGRAGKAGVFIGAVGAALLVTATLIQAIFFGGDFPLMPHFVVPGLLALVVGSVLVGSSSCVPGCYHDGRQRSSSWGRCCCSGPTSRPRGCC